MTAESVSRPLPVQVWSALDRSYPLIHRSISAALADFNLTLAQFRVLRQLEGANLTSREIAERIRVTPGNMTGIVDRLEQEGLLSRHQGSVHRSLPLQLSAKGRGLLDNAVPALHEQLASAFAPLTPAELQQLSDLLGKLEQHWSAQEIRA